MTVIDQGAIIAEINFWLETSKYFYRSFRLKRYLGEQYFLVNLLLSSPERQEFALDEILDGIPAQIKKARSPQSDLSAWLGELDAAKYVQLHNEGRIIHRAKGASLPITTTVILTSKLRTKNDQYARRVLRRLFEPYLVEQHLSRAAGGVANEIFRFVMVEFVRDWEAFLQDLSNRAEGGDALRAGALLGVLRGSTEYFVLLLSLWKARLESDDEDGYEPEVLHAFHLAIRHAAPDEINSCVSRLASQGILEIVAPDGDEENEPPRYRLAERFVASFAAFGENLVELRPRLRAALEVLIG